MRTSARITLSIALLAVATPTDTDDDWDRRAGDWHRRQHAPHGPDSQGRESETWPEGRS